MAVREQIADSGIRVPAAGGIKGAVNKLLARNLERVLAIPGGKLYRRYEEATRRAEATQREILSDIIDFARDTAFGREHGFGAISSYEEFRRAVPVRDFEGHRPWVERHTLGERDVLFPGKPMMYARSSGTTALPKLLPITPYNFERSIKNRGKLWLHGLARNFPGVYEGKDFTIVSPAVDGYTEDGTPYGSVSGVMYQHIPDFLKLVHTIPYDVITVEDYEAKSYLLLRFGVPSDVSLVLTANPASIRNLVQRADEWKEQLIRDVHDGTLRDDLKLEPAVRQMAEERLVPAPARAAELERLAGTAGALRPADYWPNLRLIHTWKCGNTGLVVSEIKPWFRPNTPILEFGYVASEITATDLMDPTNDGSLLAITNGFYEFTPVEEADRPVDRRTFLMAHELEPGHQYYVYVTTFSGLYRYDMNDVLEVVGKFNQVPVLRFLYKGKGITNLQGEKLSEAQMIAAVGRAAERTGTDHEFFVGYANREARRYDLFIELPGVSAPDQLDRFAVEVDRALQEVNIEYEAKRHTDRLGPVELIPLRENAFDCYRALRAEEGTHDGQLKWLQLCCIDGVRDQMQSLALDQCLDPEDQLPATDRA